MESFMKAFKVPELRRLKKQSDVENLDSLLEKRAEHVFGTFIDVSEPLGKMLFNDALWMYIDKSTEYMKLGKVYRDGQTSIKLVNLLKENESKVKIVGDTTWLLGYILADQLNGRITYRLDDRLKSQLELDEKASNTENEIINYMIDNFGFIPLKVSKTSLADLCNGMSYDFKTIERIMNFGDNCDVISQKIRAAIGAALKHLEFKPRYDNYYFINRGMHGWYLKADKEKNAELKRIREHVRLAKEASKARKLEQQAVEQQAVEAVITESTEA